MTAAAATPTTLTPIARAATAKARAPDPLAGLPDTDRAKAVRAWMTGGRPSGPRSGSPYGTDAEVQVFLTQTRAPKATVEDNRVAIVTYLAKSGTGLRREAVAALDNGDSAIAAFLSGGFKPALLEDMRVATATLSGTGGRAVKL